MTDHFESIAPSLKEARDSLTKINHTIGLLRLLVFAFTAGFGIAALIKDNKIPFIIGAVVMLLGFIILCAIHTRTKKYENLLNQKIAANDRYLARIRGDFSSLTDVGSEFIDHSHSYSSDLDVFGPHSLFALYNTSHSVFGRKAFADRLKCKDYDELNKESISARQKMVEALSSDPNFLLDYESVSALYPILKTPEALLTLCFKNEKLSSGLKILWKVMPFIWLVPVIFPIVGLMKYLRIAVLGVILVNLVIWFLSSRRDQADIFRSGLISKQAQAVKERVDILLSGELPEELFKPGFISESFTDDLNALIKSCSLCSLREQPITALILNALMPFDVLCADKLLDWSHAHGSGFMENVERLGQVEALMSACVPGLISKETCFPEIIVDKKAYFEGEQMSHPLLDPEKVVSNSVTIDSQTAIITGSNMSGKTTLIRTVGVMMILSYTGAMVPAHAVKCSVMRLKTSMRIADSLEENMSTFRAELVRIASIVESSKNDEPLMFLVDEVFRGTNSQDRTDGAQILLTKLNKPNISGFMTTHDYALCDRIAEEGVENIVFCHFSEKYEGDEIIFDYKLKEGMSHESNAKFLMKLVGII